MRGIKIKNSNLFRAIYIANIIYKQSLSTSINKNIKDVKIIEITNFNLSRLY